MALGTAIRGRRSLVLAVLAMAPLGIIPAAGAAQSSQQAGPAGCDSTRPGVVHGPSGANPQPAGVVPCLTYTFHDFGESNVAVTSPVTISTGTIPSAVMQSGTYPPYGLASFGLARSVDLGAHWDNVIFPASATEPTGCSAHDDPQVSRDPNTNRLFYFGEGACEVVSGLVTNCDENISFTDDNGETWVNDPGPRFQFCPAWDAPALWTAPPRKAGELTTPYPDVVYFCQSSHVVPPPSGRQCFKSYDGGVVFTEIGGSVLNDNAGPNNATAAGPDGTLYGISGTTLNISKDEGTTWTPTPAPVPIAAAGGNGPHSGPALDDQGNLYVDGIDAKNLPAVTYSTNQGQTWSKPVEMEMPGVGHVDQVALAAAWNLPGRIAVTSVGNADKSDSPDVPDAYHRGTPHHGYLTMTGDIFAGTITNPNPVFTSVQVDSNQDPLLPYGFPALVNESDSPSRVDYIGVTFSPVDGRPWAALYKDTCYAPLCATTGNSDTIHRSIWTNWLGAVATMADTSHR